MFTRRMVSALRRRGWDVALKKERYSDIDDSTMKIIERVEPYTMTSPERRSALIDATRHLVSAKVPGAMVECGVWRGGSMMAVALTLLELGVRDRELFLFDTYEGMPPPKDVDVDWRGTAAAQLLDRTPRRAGHSVWAIASLDDVRENVTQTGYDLDRVHFVPGRVEETIPARAPEQIALLRLDTDWYESTRHELEQLYPRLVSGGVLIIDDYGFWRGARQATDEYFKDERPYLHRIDNTGRTCIKP